jgi:hypothetical protein
VGLASLAFAISALAALVVPGAGKYAAIGLGLFAVAAGVVAWRRRSHAPRLRLAGAAAVAIGALAVALGGTQVALTWVALDRLAGLL